MFKQAVPELKRGWHGRRNTSREQSLFKQTAPQSKRGWYGRRNTSREQSLFKQTAPQSKRGWYGRRNTSREQSLFKQTAPQSKRGWHGRKSKASRDRAVAGRARRDAYSDFAIRPYHPRRQKACSQQPAFLQTKKNLLFQAGFLNLVGERGFEPPTPSSRTKCATRLRHSPMGAHVTAPDCQRQPLFSGLAAFAWKAACPPKFWCFSVTSRASLCGETGAWHQLFAALIPPFGEL